MSGKLRVFISSTMKDLPKERLAVRDRLESFNFEAVNAENLLPTGKNSWDTIKEEIEDCEIMVLLLGGRYGWIPDVGPGANRNISVTEMEVQHARSLGIPILPFEKPLGAKADRNSADAKRRDAFREEIKSWGPGNFVTDFKRAVDLGEKVGAAVIKTLSNEFRRQQIRDRAAAIAAAKQGQPSAPVRAVRASVPAGLRAAVEKKEAILFAGSGISRSAGLPSALAFAERFMQLIKEKQPEYFVSPAAVAFAAIAGDLEILRNRSLVTDAVQMLMEPPHNPQPTPAHTHAVRLFANILTTNFDTLFERAAAAQSLKLPVVDMEIDRPVLPTPVLVKLHGSCTHPESLMINEREILLFDKARPHLWEVALKLIRENTVVVVGSSMRDPSIIRLFCEADRRLPGYFIAPDISPAENARLKQWNMECIEATADEFLAALTENRGGAA
ncbi:MAG: DUF4062 domain-containing protein [Chthoniobacter sp.]|uniref:DUF4062 domain-containing protein n=1 Tax=Chthoniobacter sp. TaxID=2510640 RepID=UPI0032A7D936